ncbi:MAG: hypothetical protein KF898_07885 [Parachlamydiales bacterium]|nr:hypothetical protein [Verrucomicrobiota bacterium]MBX3719551.1 hypothetical protein [Candidatus Acheromyda pituitae]
MSLQIPGTFGVSKGNSQFLDAANNLNNVFQLRNGSSREVQQTFLSILPDRLKDTICFNIWHQAGEPPVANYGQEHAFDSREQLIAATKEVYEECLNLFTANFQLLPQEQQDMINYKIWHQAGEPPEDNYGYRHRFDDPFKLQCIVHETLGVDQTPVPSLTREEEFKWRGDQPQNTDNICTYSKVFSYLPTCNKPKHENFEFCSTTHAVAYNRLCDRCHIWPKLESSGKVHSYCGNLCEQIAKLQK